MSQPDKTALHYCTFLFNMWEETGEPLLGEPIWRFSLLNPHTAQRIGFKNWAALTDYIQHEIEKIGGRQQSQKD